MANRGRPVIVLSVAQKVEIINVVQETGKFPETYAPQTILKNLPSKYWKKVTGEKTGQRGRPPVKIELSGEGRSYLKKAVARLAAKVAE